MNASPPRCELDISAGRSDAVTLRFKPMLWHLPVRTAGELIGGVVFFAFTGLMLLGLLTQGLGQDNAWIALLLIGTVHLMFLYLILRSIRRMLGRARIEINGGEMVIEESFWPTGVYRSEWRIDNIAFIRVCKQQKPRRDGDSGQFTLPHLLRLQVRGKDESEDLILVGRQKRELIWACDVLNDYLKRHRD